MSEYNKYKRTDFPLKNSITYLISCPKALEEMTQEIRDKHKLFSRF